MAAGRAKKRAKVVECQIDESVLSRLLHTGSISKTGLASILREVSSGSSGSSSTKHWARKLGRADHGRFDSLRLAVDMPLADGGSFSWELAHPGRLLAETVANSPGLQRIYLDAVGRSPPSVQNPWSLIVAFDEFAPGDKLKVDNRRKAMVMSFAFRELGQAALTRTSVWSTPVIVRSCMIQQVVGGWPHFLKIILKLLLLDPCGLATGGVPLELNGAPLMLFARLGNILSDGEGLQRAYHWKGHAGLKPCLKHYNIFKKDIGTAVFRFREQRCSAYCAASLRLGTGSGIPLEGVFYRYSGLPLA